MTDYLIRNPILVRHQRVCELGAGAGLPSIVATLAGAKKVVVTDYPDEGLIENLRWNAECNLPSEIAGNLDVQVSYRTGAVLIWLRGIYGVMTPSLYSRFLIRRI
jgi:predicted nicotinamide N-methyase